jgi:hypothetical protein
MSIVRENKAIEYGDDTLFFIDQENKTAVPVWVSAKDYNKGWVDVRVGSYTAKARYTDRIAVEQELLQAHYPGNTVQKRFFSDLSYHSALNQGIAGKVDHYGVGSPYMIDFSRYTPVERYKLLYPVKASAPGAAFGQVRKSVTTYDWEYLVLNWRPGKGSGDKEWQVEHKIKRADGSDDVLYESSWSSNADGALELFNDRLSGIGVRPYKLPKDLGKVFQREWAKRDKVKEGNIKIKRRTGYSVSQSSRTRKKTTSGLGGTR